MDIYNKDYFLPYWLLLYGSEEVGFVHSRIWRPNSRDKTLTVVVFPQPDGPDSSKMPPCRWQEFK